MKNLYPIQIEGSALNETYCQPARIIAVGPLTKQPMTLAYRVALSELANGSFAVHHEYFRNEGVLSLSQIEESWFERGDYFNPNELVEATARFGERVAKQAEYLESLYREEPCQTA